MGQEISTSKFSRQDFYEFGQKLRKETELLDRHFRENKFCCNHNVGGFEIEAWLVDAQAMPAPINDVFLDKLDNPLVIHELANFNVELNVHPQVLKGNALQRLKDDLEKTWSDCRGIANDINADMMAIGIHPGIRQEELNLGNMSSSPRYKALNEQVLALRSGVPLYLNIYGRELYDTCHYDVMLEAAATSLQVHLQVRQTKAVRVYNAAMIVSAPLLAVSANSPYLFGHDLWDESRIPLFEQSVDDGSKVSKRVTFGHDYLQYSLFECFRENLDKFSILLPLVENRQMEEFAHLRLHNGTIWRWNRPLIGFEEDGQPHLRIENRVLPSGPSLDDMIANAAFYWGMVRHLADLQDPPESSLPFEIAKKNFYSAAFESMACTLKWIDGKTYPVRELVLNVLLPMAEQGLASLEMDEEKTEYYLGIIRERTQRGQNGALWQRAWVKNYGLDMQALSQAYLENQISTKAVHEWEF